MSRYTATMFCLVVHGHHVDLIGVGKLKLKQIGIQISLLDAFAVVCPRVILMVASHRHRLVHCVGFEIPGLHVVDEMISSSLPFQQTW